MAPSNASRERGCARQCHQPGILTADFDHEYVLDAKGIGLNFKLTGKRSKDGSFASSPAKFTVSFKNSSLYDSFKSLGFGSSGFTLVRMPIMVSINHTRYLTDVIILYTVKNGISAAVKKVKPR